MTVPATHHSYKKVTTNVVAGAHHTVSRAVQCSLPLLLGLGGHLESSFVQKTREELMQVAEKPRRGREAGVLVETHGVALSAHEGAWGPAV